MAKYLTVPLAAYWSLNRTHEGRWYGETSCLTACSHPLHGCDLCCIFFTTAEGFSLYLPNYPKLALGVSIVFQAFIFIMSIIVSSRSVKLFGKLVALSIFTLGLCISSLGSF